MEIIVLLLVFALFAAWVEIVRIKQTLRQQNASLTSRIWKLEQKPAPPPAVSHPIPEPAVPLAPAHMPPPIPVFTPPPPPPPPRVEPRVAEPVFVKPELPKPETVTPSPRPSPSQDWEALIGGNLLNKVGALLLVIGIMSFLAYYGTRMGPEGRAGCSVLVSLALMASGVWLERSETYRVFARGLIGAGWAALYATAYAIYALPAARIIDNPFLGSCLVLLVAGGMIGHSLRYRNQGVTAVAFFSAFAALSITPSTLFAVLSLIPLAVAVLYLAQRFDWYHMALMGVFATYGACAAHGASGAPLLESESLFIAYWALFEIFDLMRFTRRISGWAVELIFPLNAAGFLGLSYLSWNSKSPETIWILSSCAAALYLASALWRCRIALGLSLTDDLPSRIRAGSYEAPLALAAFLTAAAIVQKISGAWSSTALALEAQALFMAGIRFRTQFLRYLAMLGFLFSLVQLAGANAPVNVWVSIALFHALLFYANRAMSEEKSMIGTGFSWVASLLVAISLGSKLPDRFIGTGCMLFAAALLEFGLARKLREFRFQAYLIGFCGACQSLVYASNPHPGVWMPLAFGAAFTYAAAWRVSLLERNNATPEWIFAGWCACAATALFATVLIVKQVPDAYSGAALFGLALLLLELGLLGLPARLRVFAHPIAALAAIATLGTAADHIVKFAPQSIWLPFFLAAAAAWIMSGHLSVAPPDRASEPERSHIRMILSIIGLFFALIGLWIVVPDEFVPAAWATLGFAALLAGNALDVVSYRLEAHATAAIAAFSAFILALPDGHPHRTLAIALLIAVHIAFRFVPVYRQSRAAGAVESKLPPAHMAASVILAASLIYQAVSGSLLTMAWGAEASVLLAIGFVLRDRPLRLQGLGLFLVCVLKLFLYDLRNLETPYRILSFIALGLILLAVSWVYTRFRAQLQKLL